jgi:hypothetical protein
MVRAGAFAVSQAGHLQIEGAQDLQASPASLADHPGHGFVAWLFQD